MLGAICLLGNEIRADDVRKLDQFDLYISLEPLKKSPIDVLSA